MAISVAYVLIGKCVLTAEPTLMRRIALETTHCSVLGRNVKVRPLALCPHLAGSLVVIHAMEHISISKRATDVSGVQAEYRKHLKMIWVHGNLHFEFTRLSK